MNLDKVMTSLAGSGVLGGLAGGAVSGALINSKKARKTAGTVLKVGGIAALGGLAWKAYQGYQAQGAAGESAATAGGEKLRPVDAAPPADPVWGGLRSGGFAVDAHDDSRESRALLLLRAMIAAACADGHLDAAERERIMQQVAAADLAPDEKALVFDAMHNPPSLLELSQRVDCPELAAEVYLASVMAVDHTRADAAMYLEALAFRLGIPAEMVNQLHNQLPLADGSVIESQGERVA